MGSLFLLPAVAVALLLFAVQQQQAGARSPHKGGAAIPAIHGVTFGNPFRYNSQYPGKWVTGDGWQTAWAENDVIYTSMKDTTNGWQGQDPGSNVAIATLDGYTTAMTGSKVNTLQAMGSNDQRGTDGGSAKIAGMLSVGGVLYAQYYRGVICSHTVIMKSSDHGLNWLPWPPPTPTTPLPDMFPGNLGMAFTWVYYPSKDYPPTMVVDRNQEFVYAGWVDCNVASPNPRHVFISRVLITKLPAQVGTDWQWWQGGDGAFDGNWGPYSGAGIVATLPTTPAYAGAIYDIQYLPFYKKYMMFAYTNVTPTATTINYWTLYTADHPWGPWTQLQQNTWNPQGLYNPSIIAKSVAPDGGQTFMVISSGDYGKLDPQTGYYCIWLTPGTVF